MPVVEREEQDKNTDKEILNHRNYKDAFAYYILHVLANFVYYIQYTLLVQ